MQENKEYEAMWKGYDTKNFLWNEYEAIIVFPKVSAKGNPWVYRTEFFGAFPTVDLAMLEKGYALAHLRISDLYGAPKAVGLMNGFCRMLTENYYFSDKPTLFGFSRGGLYALHYAKTYPHCVDKLYFDAPVVDLCSWPKNMEDGKSKEWEECRKIWNLDKDKPFFSDIIEKALEEITKWKIPTVMVYGDSDEVVPYEENGRWIENAYRKAEIPFLCISKAGVGHHPHSVEEPKEIVDFLVTEMTYEVETSSLSVQKVEKKI